MIKSNRKRLITLLLILLAVMAVGLTVFSGKKAQAQYGCDPCYYDPWCYGT
jgi:hypothetical protein